MFEHILQFDHNNHIDVDVDNKLKPQRMSSEGHGFVPWHDACVGTSKPESCPQVGGNRFLLKKEQ